MQEERQIKQKYLRETILEQGYPAEDFAEYCEKICGNVDIDTWNFKDLENIVLGYIDSKQTHDQEAHNPHQTSFIDYQQYPDNLQTQRIPSPGTNHIRPPSPIKEVYRQPTKTTKKEGWKVDTFDNPPSPVRPSIANKVKLAPAQKKNLDQLFKDPFAKKHNKQSHEWDSNNAWIKPVAKPSAEDFSKNFNFDEIISKPYQTPKVKISSKVDKFHSPLVPAVNLSEKVTVKIQQKKQKQRQKQKQKQKQKPTGNPNIFDIDFSNINNVQTIKKSTFQGQLNIQKVLSPQKTQKSVSEFDTLYPNKMDWKGVKPGTDDIYNSNSNRQISLSASQSPNLGQSRRKNKESGMRQVQEDWSDIVQCIKAKTRQLAQKSDLSIVITGHQIVNRNIFVPDYVRYFVSTPSISSQVKRKYNHFVKLKANLQKFYPGFRLPYLAKGSWIQTDPSNIANQKNMITHFMNDVLMNKQLRNCRIVEQFLTLKDYKGLKVKFQQYQKMGTLHSIEELCLLEGQVGVGYSENHRVYVQKLPTFIHNMENTFEKYKRLLQQLTLNHQALQKTLNQLAETTVTMQTLSKNFNSSNEIGQCYQLQNTLKLINKLYKQLQKQSKFDMDLIQSDLKPFFRYEKDNLGTIRQLISEKNKFQESFNPNNKVEKKQVYTNTGLDQYKTRIHVPSKSLTVLRYQHGYFSNQIILQNKRMLTNLSQKLSNLFGGFCKQYQQRTVQYSTFWGNIKGAISLPIFG